MNKAVLTSDQAKALNMLRLAGFSNRRIIANIIPEVKPQEETQVEEALDRLHTDLITWYDEDFDNLILALYNGYTIED
ncbi:hypothetical protein ABEY65_27995 [Priestia aryabhattai]|uniref:hypothetical protein n=1 Tax=Priestia aryabhattai TaxID=412384 RepID=UPI003D2A6180